MNREEALIEAHQILAGIDSSEVEDDSGWWATSTGVEFGARKLSEIRALISRIGGVDVGRDTSGRGVTPPDADRLTDMATTDDEVMSDADLNKHLAAILMTLVSKWHLLDLDYFVVDGSIDLTPEQVTAINQALDELETESGGDE